MVIFELVLWTDDRLGPEDKGALCVLDLEALVAVVDVRVDCTLGLAVWLDRVLDATVDEWLELLTVAVEGLHNGLLNTVE